MLLAVLVLQVPPLLPALPEGWRRERLEFPLSFAPELEYRGVEDLAFAPGMFRPDSDSYFSYALALRLEGDVRLDEALLTRFLETYYRGLCRAVAAERELERDASTVRARVRRDGPLFRAEVLLFDPFTTGADLELTLELHGHAAPRATEVLGLASPLDAAAPIWGELHALGDAWRAARPAPVFLNHLYAVVDPETYAALAGSSLLRERFAVAEERTTVRADLTYSGLYLYGERTYFEFLQPGVVTGTGLALGVDQPDGLDAFARRLAYEGVRTQGGPITRKLEGEEHPWFDLLGLELPSRALTVFGMEYDPRFLARWHAGKAPLAGGITRTAVLERYAAALGRDSFRPAAPFADVTTIELALAAPERERLLAIAHAARWEIEEDGATSTCHAPEFRLVLAPWDGPAPAPGVRRFELALREPLEHAPLGLGRVTVSFHGLTATVDLRP